MVRNYGGPTSVMRRPKASPSICIERLQSDVIKGIIISVYASTVSLKFLPHETTHSLGNEDRNPTCHFLRWWLFGLPHCGQRDGLYDVGSPRQPEQGSDTLHCLSGIRPEGEYIKKAEEKKKERKVLEDHLHNTDKIVANSR